VTRACFVLNNIGDYHAARLADCAAVLAARGGTLWTVEASARSAFYHHKQSRAQQLMTHFKHRRLGAAGAGWTVRSLWRALRAVRPSHIFTIGYSDKLSIATLAWAKAHGVPIFFLADSKADDQPRKAIGERIKSHVVARFDGALVAGDRHRRYFRSLGVRGPIEIGYDVIDNVFFKTQRMRLAAKAPLMRRLGLLPDRYVLCVSRLVGRKRIDLALRIFAESGAPEMGARLVLIGAGPEDGAVQAQIAALGLGGRVKHLRNVANSLMPAFYGNAEALILASDFDQWGLCVNEAMALGVPCIVTQRCGVAGEIVLDGETGFVFPAGTTAKAATDLRRLLTEPALRATMSARAERMLDDWGLDRFTGSALRLIDGDRKTI
jgi:glycosyltransferase involved in cell wall biosynthesis